MNKSLNILLFRLILSFLLFCGIIHYSKAFYESADPSDSINLYDNYFIYKNEKVILNDTSLFVDPDISASVINSRYIYNTLKDAALHAEKLNSHKQINIYLAPGIYWIDNPDDNEIRKGINGNNTPFGLEINCNNLNITGLSDNPQNIVLACARGQMQGAIGNFTMFNFIGERLRVKNLTMGNYCNVDLEYPLNPEKNRLKRSAVITQSQIAFTSAKDVIADNVRFISRLNACPLVGPGPVYYNNCYIECGDDALCGNAFYQKCHLKIYSTKPFYSTHGAGAVFNECTFDIQNKKVQYFTKTGGNVTVINSEFICDSDSLNLMWSYNKKDLSTCYQYGNKLNGKPFQINSYTAYSSCNILSSNLSNYLSDSENPTQILLHPVYSEILSGKDSVIINASLKGFMDKNISGNITWSLSDKTAAKIIESDNNQCIITGLNDTDWHNEITLKAVSASGAVAYAKINIKPEMLPSPRFISNPEIRKHPGGYLKIDYKLNLGTRKDHSNILWYRCTDINGANPRLVASSTMNNPESVYYLQEGDEGYYMMASISPKHIRSEGGLPKNVVLRSPIKKGDILRSDIYTNFHNFPTIYQPEIIPGFWTVDAYKPNDVKSYNWEPVTDQSSWFYGNGVDGAEKSFGLIQSHKGARIMYMPVKHKESDMSIELEVDPCKPAGQGFGSATGQYLDICIKFDPENLTGYGLRIQRTASYDKAVIFKLVKYDNGITSDLSHEIATDCFISSCNISLFTKGNKLFAKANTTKRRGENLREDISEDVYLESEISTNDFSGVAIQHTGSTGGSAIVFKKMKIKTEAIQRENKSLIIGKY